MPPRPPRPTPPECPRCGYDLSGAIAAWPQDSCPCDGRCSECGLVSLWRDVLNPAYTISEHFFETSRRHRIRAFFRTWWQSLRPWKLWRGAQMHFAIRPARLLVFVMMAVAALWVGGAMLLFTRALLPPFRWAPGAPFIGTDWFTYAADTLWPVVPSWIWAWRAGYGLSHFLPTWLILGWLWLLLAPLTFRLVPQTLRRAKVRPQHILRIWAYSLVGIPLPIFAPAIGGWLVSLVPELDLIVQRTLAHRGVEAIFLLLLWSTWLIACWGAAAKHYLRLDHPWRVAVVLVLLGGFAVVTLGIVAAAVSPAVCSWMMNELG